MEYLLLIFAFIIGAFGRRIAGGSLSQWLGFDVGTHPQRLIWGATAALTVYACGLPYLVALACILCIWAGSSMFGYGLPFIGEQRGRLIGHDANDPYGPIYLKYFFTDMLAMTYHGIGGVLFLAIGACYLNLSWWYLVVAGMLCGPCYLLAYVVKLNVPWLGMLYDKQHDLMDTAPFAELIWGGLIGISLVLTVYGI